MNTDPAFYNLPSRTQLTDLGENHLGIRKVIKSRIIRKDAEKIIVIARQIKSLEPEIKVSLICNKNICSKSIKALEEARIEVFYLQ